VPEPGSVAIAVVLAAALTWGLRAAPFAVLASMRESAVVGPPEPAHVARRDGRPGGPHAPRRPDGLGAGRAAVPVTVGLHLWRHNAPISILAGTAVHVAPATVLAGG
jgi:branched chain amino acid efflux pump